MIDLFQKEDKNDNIKKWIMPINLKQLIVIFTIPNCFLESLFLILELLHYRMMAR